ncbi:ABC transporter ATP-binding protein [Vulcaniibacterium tengchongense]|uniref:ABC-2 type transport system ATP-binding protein/lipopolysaccharide transport system ATP-binding protein n=1 Tax=Vulcaniibacterium tengchongense TaxID=1273429 RepID=A0A3N4W0J2_9GAMM|nr:ABC transporter ATP-binding protein [Vulcaniibacterium tengchongense]RPE79600.1 ABC-2 type transport system ATP-binding protein/lipopolysaccharide transport system ATP-binding protein [Vulcaniibacterium tengchongense]
MAYIELSGVTLDLPIYEVQSRSLKRQMVRLGRRNAIAEDNDGVVVVRALNDISVRLESGDRIGLIGHNGAGKSTLLRTMAGIYSPTHGVIHREGKVVPLLDISLGMDDNSTGLQNIKLRGLLLGMSEAEIREKQQQIADFCELGDYLDLPIRTYSSGMRVRLAFAISTAVDAEILLLDEVMGVGDASFMHKAERRLADLHERSEIVVLAMHSNHEIRKVCNKVIWMDNGSIRMFGPTEEVVSAYERFVAG